MRKVSKVRKYLLCRSETSNFMPGSDRYCLFPSTVLCETIWMSRLHPCPLLLNTFWDWLVHSFHITSPKPQFLGCAFTFSLSAGNTVLTQKTYCTNPFNTFLLVAKMFVYHTQDSYSTHFISKLTGLLIRIPHIPQKPSFFRCMQ